MTIVENLESVKKNDVVNYKGIKYTDFRTTLSPRYFTVWFHLSLAYLWLIVTAAGIIFLQTYFQMRVLYLLPVIATGGFFIGYTIAYIQLFMHEAAHFNLAKNKKWNDILSNVFIGLFVGQDTKAYRIVHFDHHRYVGTPQDTERIYFEALTLRFIIESLTGIKAIKVFLNTRQKAFVQEVDPDRGTTEHGKRNVLIGGILLNGAILSLSLLFGYWPLAAAWLIGIGIIFPFFAAVRPVLEHRDEMAQKDTDYSVVAHGQVNRLFGSGLFSSTLGGAGFNRHLLHHWDPQISYTRLNDLEHFLLTTPYSDTVKRRKTTYLKTFFKLFQF